MSMSSVKFKYKTRITQTREVIMVAFKYGIMLGFALIISLGPQNIFLIKQGLLRKHPYFAASVCFVSDAILITLGVTSVGLLVAQSPFLKSILLILGVIFLSTYGILSIVTSFKKSETQQELNLKEQESSSSIIKILFLALSFSLLNPQAILDAFVLIGGNANQYMQFKYDFMIGAILASLVWFFGLVTLAKYLSRYLKNMKVWRALNFVSGFIMLLFSIKLGLMLNL